ncbi:hypothetical protein [Halalkalicoccus sp. NIPERK01]|uniref:hypothetical protein n=1 Tax=Halalkalicoccus sp. NIPERK01 TaxID=3053469 RepID=UPI00256F21DD|nr:hypothetical protein [Halalkalicoccus sp. NIPERK01]MDL5362592.1 hypothetical protein [Halalkalicoccus sp. NIPERK01]
MRTIPKLGGSIPVARSTGTRRISPPVRPPATLVAFITVIAFVGCSIAGILAVLVAIGPVVALFDGGNPLLVFVWLGALALVLAVPTLVREALAQVLRRIGY